MANNENIEVNDLDRDNLIYFHSGELPSFRARTGFSQDKIRNIGGISSQTYNSIATRKCCISWRTFLSLISLHANNDKSARFAEVVGAFSPIYGNILNFNKSLRENQNG